MVDGVEIKFISKPGYEPASFKEQLKEVFTKKYFNFLFKLGAKNAELEYRTTEFNKIRSKRSVLRRLGTPLTILGILIIFIMTTWAVFAPWISVYTFEEINGLVSVGYEAPSPAHPFGQTQFGRDVLGRLIWGARWSLSMGLVSIFISVFFGVILGIVAAYQGGWVDSFIMRVGDIMFAFPSMIITIIVTTIFGVDMNIILFTYGVLSIPSYARLIRSSALQEKAKLYVEAAQVSGASRWRIMFRHILPNSIAPILIAVTFDMGGIILSLAGLSFLGFGDQKLVEWGNDIATNKTKLLFAPWAALWPGVGIILTVLGFMLLGDGLRDALDPRTSIN